MGEDDKTPKEDSEILVWCGCSGAPSLRHTHTPTHPDPQFIPLTTSMMSSADFLKDATASAA